MNSRYLSWFYRDQAQFIEFGSEGLTIGRLQDHVNEKIAIPKVLMFASFEIRSDLHIGNFKLEP